MYSTRTCAYLKYAETYVAHCSRTLRGATWRDSRAGSRRIRVHEIHTRMYEYILDDVVMFSGHVLGDRAEAHPGAPARCLPSC